MTRSRPARLARRRARSARSTRAAIGSSAVVALATPTETLTPGTPIRAEVELAHGLANPLPDLEGDGRAGIAEQDGELLAADPGRHVLIADGGGDRAGDRAQDLVADGVAVRVVEALEPVDVDHEHSERVARAAAAGKERRELVEVATVREAGQGIGRGARRDIALRRRALERGGRLGGSDPHQASSALRPRLAVATREHDHADRVGLGAQGHRERVRQPEHRADSIRDPLRDDRLVAAREHLRGLRLPARVQDVRRREPDVPKQRERLGGRAMEQGPAPTDVRGTSRDAGQRHGSSVIGSRWVRRDGGLGGRRRIGCGARFGVCERDRGRGPGDAGPDAASAAPIGTATGGRSPPSAGASSTDSGRSVVVVGTPARRETRVASSATPSRRRRTSTTWSAAVASIRSSRMAETMASADTECDRPRRMRAKLSASPRPRNSSPATAFRWAIAATAARMTSPAISQSTGCLLGDEAEPAGQGEQEEGAREEPPRPANGWISGSLTARRRGRNVAHLRMEWWGVGPSRASRSRSAS